MNAKMGSVLEEEAQRAVERLFGVKRIVHYDPRFYRSMSKDGKIKTGKRFVKQRSMLRQPYSD